MNTTSETNPTVTISRSQFEALTLASNFGVPVAQDITENDQNEIIRVRKLSKVQVALMLNTDNLCYTTDRWVAGATFVETTRRVLETMYNAVSDHDLSTTWGTKKTLSTSEVMMAHRSYLVSREATCAKISNALGNTGLAAMHAKNATMFKYMDYYKICDVTN